MNTFAEKLGIIQEVIGYMQNTDNQTALTAKSFDTTPHITRIQGKLGNVNTLVIEQKQMQVDATNKTAEVNAAANDTYTDSSGLIDAMMGVLGKNTPEAKKLQTIRSKVRKHNDSNPPTPPTTEKS